ncbi:sulfatase family protein [Halocatena pleomorpha]|uniref:Sulfatase n=1 Tax=Halocatena pleomorpha TaxID=1785090 RepID=A0A3P3RE98_9EURY|nr:sulfatase [Halocatena pleomorpha]RRJ31832.1 sulfatase [Halocatena pleomorpha]
MANNTPNILLIHCHDLGQYLGCYGQDVDTPNIDALANEGVLFENHYATAPQCSPSRGSLMTGRYPHVNGLMGLAHEDWDLHPNEQTLPEYLNQSGYSTHLFGLQHVTDNLDRLGYKHIHSGGSLSPAVSPAIHEINRARDIADTIDVFFEKDTFEEPFFASIGFFETHRRQNNGLYGFVDAEYEAADPSEVEPLAYLPDKQGIREDIAAMHGMIRAIDDAVGTITIALEAAQLADETLVIFTTEHGIAFPRAKGTCYDTGIEAALVMRYPDVIDSGQRCDELVSNVDVLPTLLNLLGEDVPETIEGQSFLPLLTEEVYYPRDNLFAEMTWHDTYNPMRAIRTNQYKYIRNFWHLPLIYFTDDILKSKAGREVHEQLRSGRRPYEELYDLEEDPYEQTNLVNDPQYEHVRDQLRGRLVRWMRNTSDPLLEGPVPPADYDELLPQI